MATTSAAAIVAYPTFDGPDLVHDVAVARHAIGSRDHHVHHAALNDVTAGVVRDDRMGHTLLRQLPRRQRTLEPRPGLAHPDVHGDAGARRRVHGCGRGAPVHGSEPSGIAVGHDLNRTVRVAGRQAPYHVHAMLPDPAVDRHVLLCNVARQRECRLGRGERETERRRSTDQRCAAHSHARDRIHGVVQRVQLAHREAERQRELVHDEDIIAFRPDAASIPTLCFHDQSPS